MYAHQKKILISSVQIASEWTNNGSLFCSSCEYLFGLHSTYKGKHFCNASKDKRS